MGKQEKIENIGERMGTIVGNMYSFVSVPPSIVLYAALKEDFSLLLPKLLLS